MAESPGGIAKSDRVFVDNEKNIWHEICSIMVVNKEGTFQIKE